MKRNGRNDSVRIVRIAHLTISSGGKTTQTVVDGSTSVVVQDGVESPEENPVPPRERIQALSAGTISTIYDIRRFSIGDFDNVDIRMPVYIQHDIHQSNQ